jgi:prephenate dehydrogenase
MNLGIIGTGLIGSSIGIRAQEIGWNVLGFDTNAQAAEEALRHRALTEVVTRAGIYENADTIVIAAHINGTIAELQEMRFRQPRKARLIIDISSVKAPIVQAARGVRNFVATHPMAGRERSGPAAATRDVFEGKTWLYVPTGDREIDWRGVEFIGTFGAIPFEIDAEKHDRTVAFTSHLPQVLATLFANRTTPGTEAYMGPTAKELLRLSRSSPAMWHDILEANRENICRELRALADDIMHSCRLLERGENLYTKETSRQSP